MSADPATVGRYARVIRQDVRSMHAYAIQDSAGLVKLDAMENPFRLPEALQRELGRRLGAVAINRYPTRCVADVIAALSRYVALPAGCKIMLGNGSDELIALLALACDVPGASILAPVPGFVMYEMSARLQGLRFVGVPLTPTFEIDLGATIAASIASASSSKVGVSGTPTNLSPCSRADISYITKPGTGARIDAPGTSQASASSAISSSEPLPSIILQPAGSAT